MDPRVKDAAVRILAACVDGRITWPELLTLYRSLGIDGVPFHHLLA